MSKANPKEIYEQYIKICIDKGYSIEPYELWFNKQFPKRKKVNNSRVGRALAHQVHIGQELHNAERF